MDSNYTLKRSTCCCIEYDVPGWVYIFNRMTNCIEMN